MDRTRTVSNPPSVVAVRRHFDLLTVGPILPSMSGRKRLVLVPLDSTPPLQARTLIRQVNERRVRQAGLAAEEDS